MNEVVYKLMLFAFGFVGLLIFITLWEFAVDYIIATIEDIYAYISDRYHRS